MATPSARSLQPLCADDIDDGWSLADEPPQTLAIVQNPARPNAKPNAKKVWKLEALSSISDETFSPKSRVLLPRETSRLFVVPDHPPATPSLSTPQPQQRTQSLVPALAAQVPVYWGPSRAPAGSEASITARGELDVGFDANEREFFNQGDELIAEHRKTVQLCDDLAQSAGSTLKFWQRLFRRA